MNQPILIGERIRKVIEDMPKKYTVKWFAEQLNCDRRNVYDIYRRNSIDTELLWRISKILNHDFFKDLSDSLNETPLTDSPLPSSSALSSPSLSSPSLSSSDILPD